MFEYFMLQEIQGELGFSAVFGPLFQQTHPLWWYQLEHEAQNNQIARYFVSRDPEWLNVQLPKHVARMRTIAHALLRDPDDAEDAVAMALMRTERTPYIPNNFAAYMDRAVRTSAYDIQRKRLRSRTISLEDILVDYDLYDDSPSPEDEVVRTEYEFIVREAVTKLSSTERQAIQFHYFDELTIRQTASALGVSVPTAQNILYRARRNLLRILAPKVLPEWHNRRDSWAQFSFI